ncbi:hypothetical protein HL653_22470 [Sphingomonas sp. AP4-R1]|uniref:hypothetical protein n=1 Tax=Sphingomonas sp. AP4-R1 TaxID=2735134 RepID=UPI001493A111|nr:hypothetical protein [Sphingomonas sp. AP4-R1]QJU60131.1 hypothetical protein HL653_22470 [Sphingomonas sp. AP4-R1]
MHDNITTPAGPSRRRLSLSYPASQPEARSSEPSATLPTSIISRAELRRIVAEMVG